MQIHYKRCPNRNRVNVRRVLPLINNTDTPKLVFAENQAHRPGWRLSTHNHPHHELLVIVRGHQSTIIGDKTHTAGPVEAMLLPAGVSHEECTHGDQLLERLIVGFRWDGYVPNVPLQVHDQSGRLHEIAAWLSAERASSFPGADEYRQNLIRSLVAEYERLSREAGHRLELQARAYIQNHLRDTITLDDLARNAGMSRFYFSRTYRKITGQSPMEHVRLIRLEKAKKLVRTTSLPLKAIAAEVGLGSEYHLSRLLRSKFGVGVRELRAQGARRNRTSEAPLTGSLAVG